MSLPNANLVKSVLARLKNKSKEENENFNYILTRYGAERLLYRLGISDYKEQLILKGGTLFLAWQGKSYRVTRDIDFLAYGSSDIDRLEAIFKALCILDSYDGLNFLADSVNGTVIKPRDKYSGVRIRLQARLGNTRIPLQVDIGFGDILTPQAEIIKFPTLLDMPNPSIRTYSKYTMIAEKFEAMVSLGIRNSRMKDFYDIWLMSRLFELDGKQMQKALNATFERRNSPYPKRLPFVFTSEFYSDKDKQTQWKAFAKPSIDTFGEEIDLKIVIEKLSLFLMPIIEAQIKHQSFSLVWSASRQQWQKL